MMKAHPHSSPTQRSALVLVAVLMGACSTRHLNTDAPSVVRWTPVSAEELAASRPDEDMDPECYQSPDREELSDQAALLRWRRQIRTRILRYADAAHWRAVQLGDLAVWPRGGVAVVRHSGGELFLTATYERYHVATELCGWHIEPTTETWKLEQLRVHSELQASLIPGATLVHVEMGPLGNRFVPLRYTTIGADGEAHTYNHDGSVERP